MNGVLRSWACLNKRCQSDFSAWEDYPACPKCGNIRVQWIPGGGHVAGTAAAADATLRDLASRYGMSDINSAREGERAMPKLRPQKPVEGPPRYFAPGFIAPVSMDSAACLPSSARVNFKTTMTPGNPLPKAKGAWGKDMRSNTRIEASHAGKR